MPEHDLVIRGGNVIDGTGGEPHNADVAISDGRVTAVGVVDGTATRTIDADGALVTPGFVDIHTHYDGQATWDDRLAPSSWHGVTTVVASNCGVGFAPVLPSDHDRLIQLMEGVEDIPGAALHEGLPWTWQSFPEFLDTLDARRYDIDVATQLPHGALRLNVMGDRGANRDPATPDDIAEMARITREAVEAGALGFTTSRTLNHRTSTGDPTPTLTAAADELVGIAREMGRSGLGVLQVVSDFLDMDAEFGLLREMAAASGRPISFSLAQAGGDAYKHLLARTEQARTDGLEVTAQVSTRAIGVLMGLQCTLHPLLTNPVHRQFAHLTVAEQSEALAHPDVRARVLAAHAGEVDAHKVGGRLIDRFHRMYELGDPPDYEPDPATSFAARAEREGCEPIELVYDHLLADEGRSFIYVPLLNYTDGNLDAVGEMLAHPYTVPGLSDGGAHVGTICDGSFPTTLLQYWGRDRERGRMPLAELVRRHTTATARTVGLLDRGVLAPGYRADVNVIDFDRLAVKRPEMHYDLPAGGKRLLQGADGYLAAVVAGEVTYEDGEATGALPGRLVRGAQPAPA